MTFVTPMSTFMTPLSVDTPLPWPYAGFTPGWHHDIPHHYEHDDHAYIAPEDRPQDVVICRDSTTDAPYHRFRHNLRRSSLRNKDPNPLRSAMRHTERRSSVSCWPQILRRCCRSSDTRASQPPPPFPLVPKPTGLPMVPMPNWAGTPALPHILPWSADGFQTWWRTSTPAWTAPNSFNTPVWVQPTLPSFAAAPATQMWYPHPLPHPTIPAATFWSNTPWAAWPVSLPSTAPPTVLLTGGHPLPGTVPSWTPSAWPPSLPLAPVVLPGTAQPATLPIIHPRLIASPADTYMPQLAWDLAQAPSLARRLTGNHIYAPLKDLERDQAVYPKARKIVVTTCFNCFVNWGPIVARCEDGVRVYDLLSAIYTWFQARISQDDLDVFERHFPGASDTIKAAMLRRCMRGESGGLPQYEYLQGVRRVDCLSIAGGRMFWGMYLNPWTAPGRWYLQLITMKYDTSRQ